MTRSPKLGILSVRLKSESPGGYNEQFEDIRGSSIIPAIDDNGFVSKREPIRFYICHSLNDKEVDSIERSINKILVRGNLDAYKFADTVVRAAREWGEFGISPWQLKMKVT
jgi:hypothetical protein